MTIHKRRLAVRAGEARRTRAGVRALAGVEAGAAVVAGLVIGTVVEILVAEEAAPAFVAEALPGLLTASMKTPRIPHTLIAVGTFPSVVTSEKQRAMLSLCQVYIMNFISGLCR